MNPFHSIGAGVCVACVYVNHPIIDPPKPENKESSLYKMKNGEEIAKQITVFAIYT